MQKVAKTQSVVLGVVLFALFATPAAEARTKTLIPAYFSSPGIWRQADAAGRDGVLIVNPASGPGSQPLESWKRIVATARAKHVTLLGYVATGYGDDPLSTIKRQVDEYRRWYGIRGIFFDEVSSSAADLPRYRQIVRSAKHRGVKQVTLNPGTTPARGYFGIADIVVTFEATLKAFRQVTPPAWLAQVPPRKVANIVIGVPGADAEDVTTEVRDRGVGLVFVTDDDLPNPYDTLPSYFRQELSWIQ